ncbi:ATP-binding protein [Streptomyces sp. NPDC013161]|uniref:ATP-binding protein n=1 Tax=Streptomyces sp. NPDC013161 TaxID=3364862 RepID=UPI0036D17FE1
MNAARFAADLQHQAAHDFAVRISPDITLVRGTRRITESHLRLWNVPEPLAENLVLAVSELVTNAIAHGDGDIELKVRYANENVRVEVTDGSSTPARIALAKDDDTSGRGLLIVATLAWNWGVSDGGRTTWCDFRIPSGQL